MSNAISMFAAFVSEIGAVATVRVVQVFRTVNEKHRAVNVVFLAQFDNKRENDVRSRRFNRCTERFVRF
jgi:hypothetical protein